MLPTGVRRLFRLGRGAKDVAGEVDAELRFHIEEKIAALMKQGLDPVAARGRALRELGDVSATRTVLEAIDRAAGASRQRRAWLADWGLDVRQAVRSLRRTPGVTAAVVLMLALGIGANAAMFDILDRLFLRPPNGVVRPSEIHRLYRRETSVVMQRPITSGFFDTELYDAFAGQLRGMPQLAGYFVLSLPLGRGQDAVPVPVSVVTGTYFELLGVRPARGRLLQPQDDRLGATPAAVVSHDFAQRRRVAGAGVLGTTLVFDDVAYTIVGVAPAGFTGIDASSAEVWVPAHIAGPASRGEGWRLRRRGGLSLWLVSRLAPGRSALAAAAEATARLRTARAGAFDADSSATVLLGPIQRMRGPEALGRGQRLALVVGGVAAVVLLIAAANVGNLLMLRALGRRRELAVRAALGAGRWRMARLLVVESVLLALAAGAAAAAVAAATGGVLRAALLPTYQWPSGTLVLRTLLFATVLVLAVGVAVAVAPAVLAGRQRALDDLRAGARAARVSRSPIRAGLLLAQAALSLALLIGAGLFLRSLAQARGSALGFDVERLLVVQLDPVGRQGPPLDVTAVAVLERRARGLPGVTGLAQSTSAPMHQWAIVQLRIPGVDSLPSHAGFHVAGVTPGFFDVMGVGVVRGRQFSEADRPNAPKVAVVNRYMADLLWRGDALGKCLYLVGTGDGTECRTVVGIVETANEQGPIEADPSAQYYLPLEQSPWRDGNRSLIVRTEGNPHLLRGPMLIAMSELFPDLPRERIRVLSETLAHRIRSWRVGTGLFAAAATLALLLAAIGLYSVIAYQVRQRAHEFGIRRALGADAGHLMRLVLRRGFTLAVGGVVVGSALAVWGAKFIKPLLFEGREPLDPAAFGAAAAVLLVAALAATLIPAWHAARVDPRQALQAE